MHLLPHERRQGEAAIVTPVREQERGRMVRLAARTVWQGCSSCRSIPNEFARPGRREAAFRVANPRPGRESGDRPHQCFLVYQTEREERPSLSGGRNHRHDIPQDNEPEEYQHGPADDAPRVVHHQLPELPGDFMSDRAPGGAAPRAGGRAF
jgi:hypothetical protein